MAISSKDIEILWNRYSEEGCKKGASVAQYFVDMEREQYQDRIKDLLQAVETLLKANNALGERVALLEKVAGAYEDLKTRCEKLEGELAMRRRGQHASKDSFS